MVAAAQGWGKDEAALPPAGMRVCSYVCAFFAATSLPFRAAGGWVHYGATSQDINDCVTALQLAECTATLLAGTRAVRAELTRLAVTHRDVVTIARTHGQHAIPTTFGFKFANFLYEMSVAESFLARVAVPGKFSGAAGTFASLGGARGERVQVRRRSCAAAARAGNISRDCRRRCARSARPLSILLAPL